MRLTMQQQQRRSRSRRQRQYSRYYRGGLTRSQRAERRDKAKTIGVDASRRTRAATNAMDLLQTNDPDKLVRELRRKQRAKQTVAATNAATDIPVIPAIPPGGRDEPLPMDATNFDDMAATAAAAGPYDPMETGMSAIDEENEESNDPAMMFGRTDSTNTFGTAFDNLEGQSWDDDGAAAAAADDPDRTVSEVDEDDFNPAPEAPKPCPREHYHRNAKNRCVPDPAYWRSQPCPEGRYRTKSGYCKTVKQCKDGYKRNAATNRCKKDISYWMNQTCPDIVVQRIRNPKTGNCIRKAVSRKKVSPKPPKAPKQAAAATAVPVVPQPIAV